MANSRCAVDEATPRYWLTSVSRRLGCSPSSSRTRSALSTDSMGYCGPGPNSGAGGRSEAAVTPTGYFMSAVQKRHHAGPTGPSTQPGHLVAPRHVFVEARPEVRQL